MIQIDTFEGVKATVQNFRFQFLATAILTALVVVFNGCGNTTTGNQNTVGGVDPNEAAATVNGTAIKLEDVERLLKQQAQGQEAKLSPLELAQARLQILDNLIQQEVMFQKAQKENTVPTDDEVTGEFNKTKQQSGMTQEQFNKVMTDNGQTEASARDAIKKALSIQKLTEKITGKIEPPKDSEVDAFYNGNKAAFVKKKGVKLAAIVVDPSNSGEGDTTTSQESAVLAGNEIIKQLQAGEDFAKIAREKSEDPQSKLQGGDLGYIAEEELKQSFPAQVSSTLMNPAFKVGQFIPAQMQGKFFILKLQERSDKDEDVTLETPGIRQQVTDQLINARKQLLAASYQSIAMNEAKIVNNLAQKVVDNPNELSGARPAGSTDAPANTNSSSNTNSMSNSNAAGANVKPANAQPANAMTANKTANAAPVKPTAPAVPANNAATRPAATANANR